MDVLKLDETGFLLKVYVKVILYKTLNVGFFFFFFFFLFFFFLLCLYFSGIRLYT